MKSWRVSVSSCGSECQHHAGQTTDKASHECIVRGQVATGSCSVFTAALDTSVNIQGSIWLLCVPKPLVPILSHPYLNAPAAQEEATSSDSFMGHILPAHSPGAPGTSTTLLPMGCQVLLLKPTWTRVCIPDFCSHCSYAGSESVYSFASVGPTPTRFQENVPTPPIRAFMLLLEPKEGWHSVFTPHEALNSPVPWAEDNNDHSPLITAWILFKCSNLCNLSVALNAFWPKTAPECRQNQLGKY